MPFKIIRNDITKMNTDAIVNTANQFPEVGEGCDTAVYEAAGYEELLSYRKEHIGEVPEGEVFITPGFHLPAKYIIHAVSPLFINGEMGEEDKLRSCYRKGLELAYEKGIASIAFPLISTGSFGYPKEEGMRIAVDEINAFLLKHQMMIYLVVFDDVATRLGQNLYPDLESYIDRKYVERKHPAFFMNAEPAPTAVSKPMKVQSSAPTVNSKASQPKNSRSASRLGSLFGHGKSEPAESAKQMDFTTSMRQETMWEETCEEVCFDGFDDAHESELAKRMEHMSDTFSEYLLYLIESKGMTNAEVYKRAIVDKKVFSKIKNNPDYHPQKITAMCLCVGACLNLDETRDLLVRAGYALSPCDKTDIIFTYFIEHGIYDMIELDIQLEEHGLNCLIS